MEEELAKCVCSGLESSVPYHVLKLYNEIENFKHTQDTRYGQYWEHCLALLSTA